jgi:hypothetical protein
MYVPRLLFGRAAASNSEIVGAECSIAICLHLHFGISIGGRFRNIIHR